MAVPWQVPALLLVVCAFLFWSYTVQVEQRVEAEIAAKSAELSLQYAEDTAALSKEFNNQLAIERQTHERAVGEKISEINRLRQRVEKLARNNPKGFGDDFHVRLARIMCRIQAGTDTDTRETCDNAAPEAFGTDIAFTITVTPDTADIWREQCEDGHRDFCNWSITGFTPQGALTLLSWLQQLDTFALDQSQHIDGLHDLISKVTDNNPSTN